MYVFTGLALELCVCVCKCVCPPKKLGAQVKKFLTLWIVLIMRRSLNFLQEFVSSGKYIQNVNYYTT